MTEVTIRAAQLKDIDAMTVLLYELFSIEQDFQFDEHKQRKGLELIVASQDAHIFVAEYNAQVIGMCSLQTLISTAQGGPVGLIEDMVISQNYKGQGVGRKLLTTVEDFARDQGMTRVQLLADKENQPALDFYARMGWTMTQLIGLRKLT